MDLRDQFAMAAVQGLLASDVEAYEDAVPAYWAKGELLADKVAQHAYQVADAMLRVKEATQIQIQIPPIT